MLPTRHPDGRFRRGCKPGPGRPPRAKEERYIASLRASLTPEKWEAIVERAIADAAQGDSKAREWISKWVLGDGQLPIHVDGQFPEVQIILPDNGRDRHLMQTENQIDQA